MRNFGPTPRSALSVLGLALTELLGSCWVGTPCEITVRCKNEPRFYDRIMCALPFDLGLPYVSSYRILLGFAIIDALS